MVDILNDLIDKWIKSDYDESFKATVGKVKIESLDDLKRLVKDADSSWKWPPLVRAAERGQPDQIKALLKLGANPNATSPEGVPALHQAIHVLFMIEKSRAEESSMAEDPPILRKKKDSYLECINKLISHSKTNLEAKWDHGRTALVTAAGRGGIEVLKMLLAKSVNLEAAGNDGFTALIIAAEKGYADCVEALLKGGANPEATNNYGFTALLIAAEHGHADCVEALLKGGANPDAKKDVEQLHDASPAPDPEHADVDHEPEPEPEPDETAAFAAAARQERLRALEAHDQDRRGWTALHLAARRGHADCVEALLKGGANIEAKTVTGMDALFIASREGHVNVINMITCVQAANAAPQIRLGAAALGKKRRRKKSISSKKRRMKTKKKSKGRKSFNYVVAIPSYKRWEEITKKTLPTLKRGKVDKNKIHVFVANKTEEKLYKDKLDPNTYGKIVVGKKGLVQQRRFISQYFPEGTMIVSLDDDIQKVIRLIKNEKLTELKNLDSFFKKAFRLLKEKNLYLWGVYPVNNALFMKNTMTTDLRFVIGVMHGYINRHDRKLYPSLKSVGKEDIEQTILFYLKDKGVLRFNDITFRTVYNAPGGLGTNRYQMNKNAQEYLCKKYPKIAKAKFRPDGTPEVTLHRNPDI